MEIYFKFKSAKAFESLPMEGPFTTVASFKHQIYQLKYKGKQNSGLCYGNDFDITVINAQTNQPYADENTLIPSNTRLLIQRVPGGRRNKPIDTSPIIIPGSLKPKSCSSASKSTSVATASIVTTSRSCGDSEGEKSETFGVTESYPVELLCPLCERPMKDAAFTSKCCFRSFCDRCIRDHLVRSQFKCVCGAGDMLTDYLIPNVTVRGLVRSVLESGFTLQQLQASVQLSTSASKSQAVKGEEEQTKKRKRESREDVERRSCVMRTGFYPWNSFGKNFGGFMEQASFSVQ